MTRGRASLALTLAALATGFAGLTAGSPAPDPTATPTPPPSAATPAPRPRAPTTPTLRLRPRGRRSESGRHADRRGRLGAAEVRRLPHRSRRGLRQESACPLLGKGPEARSRGHVLDLPRRRDEAHRKRRRHGLHLDAEGRQGLAGLSRLPRDRQALFDRRPGLVLEGNAGLLRPQRARQLGRRELPDVPLDAQPRARRARPFSRRRPASSAPPATRRRPRPSRTSRTCTASTAAG